MSCEIPINEYELSIFNKFENQLPASSSEFIEKENPFRNYPLIQQKQISGTQIASYYNEHLNYEFFPIPEKYHNSYLLLYSEKNRYFFILEPLMTYWQGELFELLKQILAQELQILKNHSPEKYTSYLNEIKTHFIFDLSSENELELFGIEILPDMIEISSSANIYSMSYFIRKSLFYFIIEFYLDSIQKCKHLSYINIEKEIQLTSFLKTFYEHT